ncbi:hypothetical protein AK89_11610 [Enterococcus mundtii CRL35]|nr:hypothetical protein AK89_11610 [Enterococcus mundtii CRL35]
MNETWLSRNKKELIRLLLAVFLGFMLSFIVFALL